MTPSRRTNTASLAALVACAMLVPGASQAQAAPTPTAPTPGAPSCSLDQGTLQPVATPDTAMNQRFNDYGNTSGAWVGADSTYSVPLAGGQIAWVFSDTVMGKVTNGAIPKDQAGFINNSLVLDQGGRLTRTVTGGTASDPKAILATGTDQAWYWLGAATTDGNDVLVGANRYNRTGQGQWDFAWDHSSMARINAQTGAVLDRVDIPATTSVQWTSWMLLDDGFTYIYGVDDQGEHKTMHIARVAGTDVSKVGRWQYFTGNGWSNRAKDSTAVLDHVSNEYSVTKYRDGYVLVTHDTSEAFSNKILAYTSCSPTGPFTRPTTIYQTPETGAMGRYKDANIYTYNSHVHPELSSDGSLLISYNVNSLVPDQIFTDVSIYRPRFLRVRLGDQAPSPSASATTSPSSSATTTPAPSNTAPSNTAPGSSATSTTGPSNPTRPPLPNTGA